MHLALSEISLPGITFNKNGAAFLAPVWCILQQ